MKTLSIAVMALLGHSLAKEMSADDFADAGEHSKAQATAQDEERINKQMNTNKFDGLVHNADGTVESQDGVKVSNVQKDESRYYPTGAEM